MENVVDQNEHDAVRSELTGMIALHVALARMEGYVIDKKACRYNNMAEYAMHCGRCASPFSRKVAFSALDDAVSTAIVGSPMHVAGTPVDVSGYAWMEAS